MSLTRIITNLERNLDRDTVDNLIKYVDEIVSTSSTPSTPSNVINFRLVKPTAGTPPTITEFENNTNIALTPSYDGVGLYRVSFSSALDLNLTHLLSGITRFFDAATNKEFIIRTFTPNFIVFGLVDATSNAVVDPVNQALALDLRLELYNN